jgi:hypothetical protein
MLQLMTTTPWSSASIDHHHLPCTMPLYPEVGHGTLHLQRHRSRYTQIRNERSNHMTHLPKLVPFLQKIVLYHTRNY